MSPTNPLAKELKDKAESILKMSSDLDLTDAAVYMLKAVECLDRYEKKLIKQDS